MPDDPDAADTASPSPRQIKVMKRCPRCRSLRAIHSAYVLDTGRPLFNPHIKITCSECGHEWIGRFTIRDRLADL